ncbi:cullin protein [Vairimorpha necatrix]|uniref:Cullin protein n=1 Tax=Vairimorpha necatrix TaxID=6039 RepID=A0AAX4JAI2_9MICR
MSTDLEEIENFLTSYFNHRVDLVLYKIYEISRKHSKSIKFYRFLKYKMKKLLIPRVNKIDTKNIYDKHVWFTKMIDLFNKIFRDTKKMHKIEKYLKFLVKKKLETLKNEFIFKTATEFLMDNYEKTNKKLEANEEIKNNIEANKEIEKFYMVNEFYNLNFVEDLKKIIINRFVNKIIECDINKIKIFLENINDDLLNIKNRIFNEVAKEINKIKILKCLENKEYLEFNASLFENAKDKYKEYIIFYLNNKFNDNKMDKEYVNNILKIYLEYKKFDDFVKSVIFNWLKNLNINFDKFVNVLNSGEGKSTELFEFLGILYNFITEKEAYEKSLRTKLCYRLINNLSTIEEEEYFISIYKTFTKDIYVYKMVDCIEDFKNRIFFYNCEIMMMRKFQWAEFKNVEIFNSDLSKLKNKYENQIAKFERKKICWMDSLSTVEVEIYGKEAVLNLVQYDILLNINNLDLIKILNENKDQEKILNIKILQDNGLLKIENEKFFINKDFECKNFNIKERELLEINLSYETSKNKKHQSEVLDSKIMSRLKKYKKLEIIDLLDISNKSEIIQRLEILEKKGYCHVKNEEVLYKP